MPTQRTGLQRVDPAEYVTQASALLRDVWQPPCLDYTAEYLRFHTSFPSSLEPVSIAAPTPEGELLAFVAATGRRSSIGEIYLSSFLAVRSGVVSAVPMMIVRDESRAILASRRPLLVFAQAGSAGESMLACFDSVGLHRHSLGRYTVHAAVAKQMPAEFEAVEVEPAQWATEAKRLAQPDVLTYAFDDETLAHFAASPEPRMFVAAVTRGQVVGIAMSGVTHSLSASGSQSTIVLHYVRVREGSPEALVALMSGVAQRANPKAKIVSVPNVANLAPEVTRRAGLRATPTAFSAFLYTHDGDAMRLRATDFEIV